VVGGFLAPSSDAYVAAKLGSDALSFEQRRRLCEAATRASDWISVCNRGEFSSNVVRRAVKEELELRFTDDLRGCLLTAFEIMGSDTAARLFRKVIAEGGSNSASSTQRNRMVCCLYRVPSDRSAEPISLQTDIADGARRLGISLIFVDAALSPISSSVIRELIAEGNWATLGKSGWLHPGVLRMLKNDYSANNTEQGHG
jgi:hypothetical protein